MNAKDAKRIALGKRDNMKEERFDGILETISQISSRGGLHCSVTVSLEDEREEFSERLRNLGYKTCKREDVNSLKSLFNDTLVSIKTNHIDIDWS